MATLRERPDYLLNRQKHGVKTNLMTDNPDTSEDKTLEPPAIRGFCSARLELPYMCNMLHLLYAPCSPAANFSTNRTECLAYSCLLEIGVDGGGKRPRRSSQKNIASEVEETTRRIPHK